MGVDKNFIYKSQAMNIYENSMNSKNKVVSEKQSSNSG